MFLVAEAVFQHHTNSIVQFNKFNHKVVIEAILKDARVTSSFSILVSLCDIDINKEIGRSLLEELIGLYVRTRTFSYVKDQQQNHKLSSDHTKETSLRTGLKKKSTQLDQGH